MVDGRCLFACMLGFFASCCPSAEGVRERRRSKTDQKFIAGVPVLNYRRSLSGYNVEEDWVVVVDVDTPDDQIRAMCKASACKMTGHPSEGGVPFFVISGTEADLENVLKVAAGKARFVEHDPVMNLIPDDEQGPELEETMGIQALPSNLAQVGAGSKTASGKGVNIYVFDSGIRTTHRDFGGRAVPTIDVTSGSVVECNGDVSCARDVRGHGTHCAGTAGGSSYGVATDSVLRAVKVLDDKGAGPWSVITGGLDWVVRKHVRPAVASMSLGGPGQETSVKVAVDTAVKAGITVVVAAGNQGKNSCEFSPAFVPSAIAVGASTKTKKVAFFSNWGPCIAIWAPGIKIKSASASSDTRSTEKSGTSQAAPLVAAAAALMLEADPGLKPSAIRQALHNNAKDGLMQSLKEGDVNKFLWVGS